MGASSVAPGHGLGYQQQAMSVDVVPAAGPVIELDECDACPSCRDTCDRVESCISCQKKLNAMRLNALHDESRGPENGWLSALTSLCHMKDPQNNDESRTYTTCQLRRHNHADSAWILVGDTIYDATPYIRTHPGGLEAILRKSGGAADCTEDLRFHSKRAQKEWRRHMVGKLIPCGCQRDCRQK